jgi:hypothetical protein
MRKYTKTDEKAKVLSPDAHKSAQAALHKRGKTSAGELTDSEREKFSHDLNQQQ